MENIPSDLRYTKSHEWVREIDGGAVEIGITDHAQGALGDLVFVEVPDVGRALKAGEACAVVESVKAASDVYSPLAGQGDRRTMPRWPPSLNCSTRTRTARAGCFAWRPGRASMLLR